MELLRASEVAEYVYCARSWWLRRQGVVPEGRAGGKLRARLERGRRSHAWHSLKVHASAWLVVAALLLLIVAAGIALADGMMMIDLLPPVLGALAVLLLIAAIGLRQRSGVPWGIVRDDDAGIRRVPARPLRSRRFGLVGRPDYVLERGRHVIPVELKPDREADQPFPADLAQLAAYLLLIEEQSGSPPPYGLLRYKHHTFRLRYTRRVRQELLTTLSEMRDLLPHRDVSRSHDERARCVGCALRSVCGPHSLLS